jgi:starch phosphorylase
MNGLYDRYLGPRWREEPADKEVWGRAAHIAPGELWRTHERRRERLVAFVRRCLRQQLERRGAPRATIQAADEVLDPQALTVGFARRFATYKRAALLLRDEERLASILNDSERPVQVIYAGKAHPQDEAGKKLIARIVELSGQERFRRRVVFLEDYGMAAARYLVQGCDVWLNTPRRPHEASGTSGIKAAANGVLNISTLDGWWAEAYTFDVGWAIGRGEVYEDAEYQDDIESHALYDLLERDVVPMFYDRGPDGLPRRWIERVKHSIEKLNSFFNTHRMVKEYTERFYLPTAQHFRALAADGMARAKALAAWKARARKAWPEIEIRAVEADLPEEPTVGDLVRATARVDLNGLAPDDVRVEFAMGQLDVEGHIIDPQIARMSAVGQEEGAYVFETNEVRCENSGRHGYTLRVLPDHKDLVTPFLPGLIAWAGGAAT